jgi:hypothetical protein
MAPYVEAYPAKEDDGAGAKLMSTRRQAVAPMRPIAPIV